MSILSMESWMAFASHNGDDAANNAMRAALVKAFLTAGYEYHQDQATAGWIVRPHPVNAARRALVFSASAGGNFQYVLRSRVSDNSGVVIGGFSLFVPNNFVVNAAQFAAYPFLVVFAAAPGSALNKMNTNGNTTLTDEVFRIRYDLQVGYGTEVQSSRKVTPGKMVYLEYRVSQTEVRVWLDDVLVLQKSIARNNSTIAFGTMSWLPGGSSSGMFGDTGRWAISDWYNLKEDEIAPNARLGPSTRVIGTLPAADNFAQFARPSGFASNAAVVAQPLNPDAAAFLKTDTVGAQDVYVGTPDSDTSTAAMVHAMSVKVIAQNVEATPHTMKPMIVSNGQAQGAAQAMPQTLGPLVSYSTIDPNTGAAWTPAAAAETMFGMKLET